MGRSDSPMGPGELLWVKEMGKGQKESKGNRKGKGSIERKGERMRV
jgi:hypothetical protein